MRKIPKIVDDWLNIFHIKDFFDYVYLFDHCIDKTAFSHKRFNTRIFYEWESLGVYRELPLNDVEHRLNNSLFELSQIKTNDFHICFILNIDNGEYDKILFLDINTETGVLFEKILEIMAKYFKLNQSKYDCKAFNQTEFKNKFIKLYLKMIPVSRKLNLTDDNIQYKHDENGFGDHCFKVSFKEDVKLNYYDCKMLTQIFATMTDLLDDLED